jgi:ethanolamine ammonia-lyase small subunit
MSNPFDTLKEWTQARIGLHRVGSSLSTRDVLQFRLAHAQARDAVHSPWNVLELKNQLNQLGTESLIVQSCVSNRTDYLRRPDLGRTILQTSQTDLKKLLGKKTYDLVWIVSDGLSSFAIDRHFLPFWEVITKSDLQANLKIGPVILAPFSRVALGDEIGALSKAKLTVMLIGERPGLSSTDSLGIYLTYSPRPGKKDSNRNCISNVRPPEGMSYEQALNTLGFLLRESLRLKISGIELKDESANLPKST